MAGDSQGVKQFDIKVERSSELQEIQSTNNTLQEVYIVNGTTKGKKVSEKGVRCQALFCVNT